MIKIKNVPHVHNFLFEIWDSLLFVLPEVAGEKHPKNVLEAFCLSFIFSAWVHCKVYLYRLHTHRIR